MTGQEQIRAAVATVRSARQAINGARRRRAPAAVAAANDLADAAHAVERAEKDAAREAVAVGMPRLTAEHLTPPQIAALCGLPE